MGKKYILGRISQNRAKAAKYILTESALFLTVIVLQTTLFSKIRLLGVVPDLCFGTLLLISFFCGKEAGAVTGIAAGFAVEAIGSVGISLLPVFYLFCGYVCGYFTRAMVPRRFGAFAAVLGAAVPVRGAITLVYICLTYDKVRLIQILIHTVLPEMLVTAAFACVLYAPVKGLCNWMNR